MVPLFTQRKNFRGMFACLLILVFLVSSCSTASSTQTAEQTTLETTEAEITSSPESTETATATPTLLSADAIASSGFGLVVLSMGDGKYSHLFVYDPYTLPFTRLTADNWDDEDPAISPDGKQIAFASNRGGQWDIYILDLTLDKVQQITDTKSYDGAPAWSPDGQNLIYQTENGGHVDLIIQTITDLDSTPIQITENAGDNFDADWSPDGQQIVFTTNRNGRSEIWLFDLKSTENRFKILASSDEADFVSPQWSHDGTSLAWCRKDTEDHIETLSMTEENATPRVIGLGCSPAWSPDDTSVFANYQQPNSQYFVAYNLDSNTLALPMIRTQSQVQSTEWLDTTSAKYLINYINLQSLPAPAALYTTAITSKVSETGRNTIIELEDVKAPYPYLSDTTDEAFNALRAGFGRKVGWDFLATLDNAYLPLTASTYPGLVQNWLFSGRGIAVDSSAMSAGWMAVTREDYGGETYWRVWVKCLDQTGKCGKPILSHTWDFSARNSGALTAYEDGGALGAIPDGYWVDFTEYASRYGWERLPAQSDWRYYYQGSLFNHFIFRQGLTWKQAMLQINSPEAMELIESTVEP